jgi:hypothetical protein
MRDRRGAYRVLVGIPDRKRPFGRPRHKYENNIKMRGVTCLPEVLLDAFASAEGLCSMSYPVRELTFTPVLPQLIN